MPKKSKDTKQNKTSKSKIGRPKKEIDQKQFEEMCKIQCTEEEICNILDVGVDKLLRWCMETYNDTFTNTYKKLSANGKMSLRRFQYQLAQRSASMGIWLGKQYLGQTDNIDSRNDNEEDDPITKAIKESLKNEH